MNNLIKNHKQYITKIGQKRPFFNFLRQCENAIFSDSKDQAQYKKLANSYEQIANIMQKTSIFGHFGPKWPILDSFFWQKQAKCEFFKKALGTFRKKVMNGFREAALHTDRRDSLGLHNFVERPKKQKMGKKDFLKKALGTFFPPF